MLIPVNDVKTIGALARKVRKAQQLDQLTAAAVAVGAESAGAITLLHCRAFRP